MSAPKAEAAGLTDVVAAELRAETDRIVTEWTEWVEARSKAKRSSMPVYLYDVAVILAERELMLATLATRQGSDDD